MTGIYNAPVLFLVFNRPDTTLKVFEKIQSAKPKRLYIASDGPRKDKIGEKTQVLDARKIAVNVNWDCEVKTLFRDKNLGCKVAIKEAIDWFFGCEEEGIILEDDCIPDMSFFPFCEQMLQRYRDVSQVKMISGHNHFYGQFDDQNQYFFSPYANIWGWATWRRTWKKVIYDIGDIDWDDWQRKIKKTYNNKFLEKYFFNAANLIKENKFDSWDFFLSIHLCTSNGLSITPYRNLIKNIGLNGRSQGESFSKSQNNPTVSMDICNMDQPRKIEINKKAFRAQMHGINQCIYGDDYRNFFKCLINSIWWHKKK